MIELILTLAVIGVIAWAITTYLPMPAPFSNIIILVAVIACVYYVARFAGIGI